MREGKTEALKNVQDEDLDRVSVFCCETERSRELVVELVNVLVDRSVSTNETRQHRSLHNAAREKGENSPVVEESVREIVPSVFEYEEESDLIETMAE
jgi:hypothetical protein